MTKLAFAFASAVALASIGGCKKKGGDGGAGNAMAKMAEFKDRMCACKDPECARKVSDEMTAWNQTQAGVQKEPANMTEADKKKATEIGTELGECMQKALRAGAPATGSATTEPTGSGSAAEATGSGSAVAEKIEGLPPECGEYQAAIEKLSTCDKISKEARETLIKAYTDASAGWKTLPDAAKEKIAGSCKAGAESVTSMAKAQCGW